MQIFNFFLYNAQTVYRKMNAVLRKESLKTLQLVAANFGLYGMIKETWSLAHNFPGSQTGQQKFQFRKP